MHSEPIRPYAEAGYGPEPKVPHLADYFSVVSRRRWLVISILVGTLALATFFVGQRQPVYRSTLSVQVNDPWQRTRSLTRVGTMAAADVFVDPIRSEIEVLGSTPIAAAVVDSLGLRLTTLPLDPDRSTLVDDVSVSAMATSGMYFLTFDGDGSASLTDSNGLVLGSAPVGTPIDAGSIQLTPRADPSDPQRYTLVVQPREQAVLEVRRGLNAIARESTNIIDASYTGADSGLVPSILEAAALALREYGAARVAEQASREVEFIEQRLDSAFVQLEESLGAIRLFKESGAFTDLSLQEQALINQSETYGTQITELEGQRRVLSGILRRLNSRDDGRIDDVRVLAELPGTLNPQIRELVGRLQERRGELERLVTSERKTEDHPEVRALRTQLSGMESDLVSAVQANLEAVEDRLRSANRARSQVRGEQRRFPGLENQLQTLELQQNLDRGTYEFLLSQLYQARITEAAASPYVAVLDPPSSVESIIPNRWMTLFLAGVLGLTLALGLAVFLDYLDRTLRSSHDVQDILHLPVLGVIPQLEVVKESGRRDAKAAEQPLLIALDPGDPASEAYRTLRLNLMYTDGTPNSVRTVNFTSAGPNEGKSTSALNFAVLVARQRERVLLVEADLRRPKLALALGIEREPGLSDILRGTVDVEPAIRRDVLPNLDVLTSGTAVDNPSDLLNSRAMEELLGALETQYNYVVIDSPPILAVTDAAVLAAQADGSVLVVRSGRTDQRAARRAMEQLDRVGVHVLGAVLNEVPPNVTEESYYFKYIYSYYSDGSRKRAAKVAAS